MRGLQQRAQGERRRRSVRPRSRRYGSERRLPRRTASHVPENRHLRRLGRVRALAFGHGLFAGIVQQLRTVAQLHVRRNRYVSTFDGGRLPAGQVRQREPAMRDDVHHRCRLRYGQLLSRWNVSGAAARRAAMCGRDRMRQPELCRWCVLRHTLRQSLPGVHEREKGRRRRRDLWKHRGRLRPRQRVRGDGHLDLPNRWHVRRNGKVPAVEWRDTLR